MITKFPEHHVVFHWTLAALNTISILNTISCSFKVCLFGMVKIVILILEELMSNWKTNQVDNLVNIGDTVGLGELTFTEDMSIQI